MSATEAAVLRLVLLMDLRRAQRAHKPTAALRRRLRAATARAARG